MDNISSLSRRAKSACERLSELYRIANSSPSPSPDLLPSALKELGIVSEALQIAIQELDRQYERVAILQSHLQQERQRYDNLFDFIPDGCLITDASAVIQGLNRAGMSLLNAQPQAIVGKTLMSLIVSEDLPLFQAKLTQMAQQERIEFSVRMYRRPTTFINVALTLQVIRDAEGNVSHLQWLMRDITERKRAEAALESPNYNPSLDRSLFHYSKGDMVEFEPQSLWLVVEGVVKLTTISERGEEMLVGLVGDSMVFGPSLTALQTYQAIALSDVKLALIPISEIAQSPKLAQAILSSLKQRLQQTESLLAIYGQIRVEERLNSLLMLLKQAIGQPTEQGTRLRARLTHQDFASACCTTRVTVTRLLGKLQDQGKITQDAHNHLVLKE
jgi:PAS domain S-box-containing protein